MQQYGSRAFRSNDGSISLPNAKEFERKFCMSSLQIIFFFFGRNQNTPSTKIINCTYVSHSSGRLIYELTVDLNYRYSTNGSFWGGLNYYFQFRSQPNGGMTYSLVFSLRDTSLAKIVSSHKCQDSPLFFLQPKTFPAGKKVFDTPRHAQKSEVFVYCCFSTAGG